MINKILMLKLFMQCRDRIDESFMEGLWFVKIMIALE